MRYDACVFIIEGALMVGACTEYAPTPISSVPSTTPDLTATPGLTELPTPVVRSRLTSYELTRRRNSPKWEQCGQQRHFQRPQRDYNRLT